MILIRPTAAAAAAAATATAEANPETRIMGCSSNAIYVPITNVFDLKNSSLYKSSDRAVTLDIAIE